MNEHFQTHCPITKQYDITWLHLTSTVPKNKIVAFTSFFLSIMGRWMNEAFLQRKQKPAHHCDLSKILGAASNVPQHFLLRTSITLTPTPTYLPHLKLAVNQRCSNDVSNTDFEIFLKDFYDFLHFIQYFLNISMNLKAFT